MSKTTMMVPNVSIRYLLRRRGQVGVRGVQDARHFGGAHHVPQTVAARDQKAIQDPQRAFEVGVLGTGGFFS